MVAEVKDCEGAWAPKLTLTNALSVHCICALAGSAVAKVRATPEASVINVLFIILLAREDHGPGAPGQAKFDHRSTKDLPQLLADVRLWA